MMLLWLAISVVGVGFGVYSFIKLTTAQLRLDTWVRFGAAAIAERNVLRGWTNRIDSSANLSNLSHGMFTVTADDRLDHDAATFIQAYNRAIDSKLGRNQ